MSKKYVFFKLSDQLKDSCESDLLSELEISAFLVHYEIIQNVFQLQQNNDLKLLINKSELLQNLITNHLPQSPYRHGYLWTGEDLPDLDRILACSGLINECFIFKKATDPWPKFESEAFLQLAKKLNIYNWQIYITKSFQFLYNQLSLIRQTGSTESDIDRDFDILWKNLKYGNLTQPSSVVSAPASDWTEDRFYDHSNFDLKLSPSAAMKWLRALINHLDHSEAAVIYHPFAGKNPLLTEAKLAGKSVIAAEINPVRCHDAIASLNFLQISLTELGQAFTSILSHLKILLASDKQTQFDLFLSGTDKQFKEFWITEQARLQSLKLGQISSPALMVISAIRFLIESKAVSKSTAINSLLLYGLINVCRGLIKRKKVPEVRIEYEKELGRVYLDRYAFHKINQIARLTGTSDAVYNQSVLRIKSIKDQSVDALLGFFPARINKRGFDRQERTIIDLLNLHPHPDVLEQQKFGIGIQEREKIQAWSSELKKQGRLYALLGSEAQKILSRFLQKKRSAEAVQFLKLWIDGYYFLLEVARILKNQANGCLIFQHPYFKLNEYPEEISTLEVFRELIKKHQNHIPLTVMNVFQKPLEVKRFGKDQHYHLLIFRKERD